MDVYLHPTYVPMPSMAGLDGCSNGHLLALPTLLITIVEAVSRVMNSPRYIHCKVHLEVMDVMYNLPW